jgi:tetratricopeptide (TPR) repeat protein
MRFRNFLPAAISCLLCVAVLAAPAQAPKKTASALEKGWTAYKAADYKAALDAARTAQKEEPGNPSVLELWGRTNLAMGQPRMALGALNILCRKRGTVQDYRLLALADTMAGRAKPAAAALAKAETAKDPTPEALYALAWDKPTAQGRLGLLQKIAKNFPEASSALKGEIAFWKTRASIALRKPEKPLPPDGVDAKLKTLYNMEWLVCSTGSGQEIWMMVDTAARQTIISKETAEKLRLTVVQGAYPPAGAYPGESAHSYAVLDALDLGGYKIANVPVLVVDDQPATLKYREGRNVLKGILGMDLLAGLKVRFDRHHNVFRILPGDAPIEKLLGGKADDWHELPAFSVYNQVFVPSSLGSKDKVVALFDTGCSLVLAQADALPGSGLAADSRKTTSLAPRANFNIPEQSVGTALSKMDRMRPQVLGWLEECLPMVGTVRTIPNDADVGFGPNKFKFKDLPVYPGALGGDVPAALVLGRKVTDFFAVALDLSSGKLYFKQVLFAK